MTASILISKPIHIRSQCELATVNVVPVKTVVIISKRVMGLISMGRI